MDTLGKYIIVSQRPECIFQSAVGHGPDASPCKYLIEDIPAFWKEYDNLVASPNPPPLYFMERPTKTYSYLRFDVDFKPAAHVEAATEHRPRLYNDTFVRDFILEVHRLIDKLVRDGVCDTSLLDASNYICSVFTKNSYAEKDGLHLAFPNLFCEHQLHNGYFVKNLQRWVDEYKLTEGCKSVHVDKICSTPWVLLGSRKNKTSMIYSLSVVYDKHFRPDTNPVYKLPSTYSVNRLTGLYYKSNIAITRTNVIASRLPEQIDADYEYITNFPYVPSRNMLDLLGRHRWDEYNLWLNVLWILFDIGNGQDRFLELFKQYSRNNSDKYDERVIDKKWKNMTIGNHTIQSLHYLIRKDAPQTFDEICKTKNINYVSTFLLRDEDISTGKTLPPITNRLIADIIYTKYESDFIFATLYGKKESGNWYAFRSNRWVPINSHNIKQKLLTDTTPYITSVFEEILTECDNDDDSIPRRDYIIKAKKRAEEKLGSMSFLDATVRMCETLFSNDMFEALKDKNNYLIGCENGVVYLHPNGPPGFRESWPSDMTT